MNIDTHIKDNQLILDHAVVKGEGLNLFARGNVDLNDLNADITLLIAPLKSVDTIISKLPIIGQPIICKDGSIIAIPVAIKGQVIHLTGIQVRKGQHERIVHIIDIGNNALATDFPIKKSRGISGGGICTHSFCRSIDRVK